MLLTVDDWIHFAESGNQQRIRDLEGQLYQGWIMEISDEALLISTGDGERGVDHWLSFHNIDQTALWYFDSQQREWTQYQCQHD